MSVTTLGESISKPMEPRPGRTLRLLYVGLGAALSLVGLILLAGGLQLAVLGGSYYYLVAGAGLVLSGILLCRRDLRSLAVFALVYAGTLVWAIWEAGFTFWPQIPRLAPFLVMGVIMAHLWGWLNRRRRRFGNGLALTQLAIIAVGVGAMFFAHGTTHAEGQRADVASLRPMVEGDPSLDWHYYGRDAGATHFAPFDQINRGNVYKLAVAWTFRTGEINDTPDFQATPLQIGRTLYLCTAHNRIFAIDADTGRQKWSFDPKVKAQGNWNRCRGVSYYSLADAVRISPSGLSEPRAQAAGFCSERIIATTVDAQLLALDAHTGRLCTEFGQAGIVDLTRGLGAMKPGWYYPTSAPLVARGHVIVGGWVSDNQSTDEPGGVVRAFDAVSGRLIWAWDPGQDPQAAARSRDVSFARSTPNFWGTATFDDKLGLVYVPTGSGTPDHWGGNRSAGTDRYSTSVIALDVKTGRLAWHYQTVHHDLWDWDLSAPPTFVDMPDGKGSTVPALIQVGKAGQIFVLDRRTGRPVTQVVEQAVPQGVSQGDRLSPTQPYSIGMPQVIPQTLSEKKMWGATFFDQLACRIQFRRMNFKGQYTPPSLTRTPISPGYLGGMNWGGVAIDKRRNLLVVNDIRLATLVRLVPAKELAGRAPSDYSHASYELQPQQGAPFGVELSSFLSLIGLPCEQPPWGMITGIDLKTRTIAWQIPAGTVAEEMGKLTGIYAPLPIGMPTVSGAIATSSRIIFYAGTNDAYVRGLDTATGKLLWKSKLPAGSQATPMTYVSPATGRQYLVVAAGGAPYSANKGDYVVAYALPLRK